MHNTQCFLPVSFSAKAQIVFQQEILFFAELLLQTASRITEKLCTTLCSFDLPEGSEVSPVTITAQLILLTLSSFTVGGQYSILVA